MTLHRAIDVTADPVAAVEVAVRLGIDRILTSGGAGTAMEGRAVIRRMVGWMDALLGDDGVPCLDQVSTIAIHGRISRCKKPLAASRSWWGAASMPATPPS